MTEAKDLLGAQFTGMRWAVRYQLPSGALKDRTERSSPGRSRPVVVGRVGAADQPGVVGLEVCTPGTEELADLGHA